MRLKSQWVERSLRALVFATASLSFAATSGCNGGDGSSTQVVDPPAYGKADGLDQADVDGCRVILRKVQFDADSDQMVGFIDIPLEEIEAGGRPNFIFSFDIAADGANDQTFFGSEDGRVSQRLRELDIAEVPADERSPLGQEGRFTRFEFRIDVTGEDAVELIPFLQRAPTDGGPEGDRFWDHNRDSNGAEGFRPNIKGLGASNYVARRGSGIPFDGETCPRVRCSLPTVQTERAYPNVRLRDPVSMKWEPTPSRAGRRVFVAEKIGRIVAFPDRDDVSNGEVEVFLDWSNAPAPEEDTRRQRRGERTYNRGIVGGTDFGDQSPGWEEGLLDFEFHPRWPDVPFVYATYNSGIGQPGNGNQVRWNLARFTCADAACERLSNDPADVKVMISLPKKGLTHNAGAIVFDPNSATAESPDLMYVSIGSDGTFPQDPAGHSQNPGILFGSIIRIDVNPERLVTEAEEEFGFAIPEDNPFVTEGPGNGLGADPRVFVYGNRNPWRISFDAPTGRLVGAEVGENAREELNLYEAGRNYGFPLWEGTVCTDERGKPAGCPTEGLTFPLLETYASGSPKPADGINGDSITGGFVYRGNQHPDLDGFYVFGDFIQKQIMGIDLTGVDGPLPEGVIGDGRNPVILAESGKNIAAFGQNPEGELFVIHHNHKEFAVDASNRDYRRQDGEIHRVVPGACRSAPPEPPNTYAFLSVDGAGSERTALAYYRSILPEGRDTESYSLQQWKIDSGIIDEAGNELMSSHEALYRNCWDLCFWREMHCTDVIESGRGGCWVTNWTEEADSPLGFGGPSGASDLGTVCMNLAPPDEGSAEAYTRFYVFVPQGETFDPLDDDARVLSPFAILDDEKGDGPTEDDKKYVPNLCTPCHGGSAYTFNSHPNIGAQFREFDHSLMTLELGQAFDSGDLEDAFLFLNQSALSANASLGPVGQNLVTFLTEDLYPQSQNGVLRGQPTSAFDPGEELIPASWRTISDEDAAALGGDQARIDAYQRAKAGMWNDLVNPVCMTCHRMRKVEVNPSDYAFFKELGEEKNGVRALDGFMTGDPTDLEDHPPFMPHSQNLYERINGVTFDAQGNRRVRTYSPDNGNGGQDFPAPGARWDPTEGQAAVDALQTWYAALDNLRPATCEVQFRIHTDATQFGEEVFIVGEAVAFDNEKPAGERLLGGWVPWKGLQLSGATFPDWTGSIELPDGVEIQYKPVIVDERQGALNACGDDGNTLVRWANGDNRTFQVDCDGGKTVVDVDPLFQGPACQQ